MATKIRKQPPFLTSNVDFYLLKLYQKFREYLGNSNIQKDSIDRLAGTWVYQNL